MAFDAILGAFFDSMGGPNLLLLMLSLVIVFDIGATLVRPFLGKV